MPLPASRHVLDSHNSPLQIGQICVAPHVGAAAVGFTICPGKRQDRSVSGRWRRDLGVDLDAIARWGAAAVVTLMPHDELQAVQVPAQTLGEACEERGMEWHHLPICDVDVPDAGFETAWCYAGLRLRAHLRRGARVLVHCRGGLGRSGTMAARLLVELGWPARQAIAAVRAQRPGAIETQAQERHVLQLPGAISEAADAASARVLGCVLGGAVGDAFGYAIEFDRWPAIERRHGPQGLQQPVLRGGQLVVSDDTQMSLFTIEALNLALPGQGELLTADALPALAAACRSAYLRWGATQGIQGVCQGAGIGGAADGATGPQASLQYSPAMRHLRAPGNTCLSAIRAGAAGTLQQPINDSKGCGGVMRTAPIGLMRGAAPALALRLGCMAGALTHGHVDGWLPAGMVASAVRRLMQGAGLEAALQDTLALAQACTAESPAPTRSPRLLERALVLARSGVAARVAHGELGEGWTGDEALAIAAHAVLRASSFEEAIRSAANHDGDSDSTASIAGQLHGAHAGVLAVPHAWLRRLDVLDDALRLCQRFLQLQAPFLADGVSARDWS